MFWRLPLEFKLFSDTLLSHWHRAYIGRLEPTKLVVRGTRTTYQATGEAGRVGSILELFYTGLDRISLLLADKPFPFCILF